MSSTELDSRFVESADDDSTEARVSLVQQQQLGHARDGEEDAADRGESGPVQEVGSDGKGGADGGDGASKPDPVPKPLSISSSVSADSCGGEASSGELPAAEASVDSNDEGEGDTSSTPPSQPDSAPATTGSAASTPLPPAAKPSTGFGTSSAAPASTSTTTTTTEGANKRKVFKGKNLTQELQSRSSSSSATSKAATFGPNKLTLLKGAGATGVTAKATSAGVVVKAVAATGPTGPQTVPLLKVVKSGAELSALSSFPPLGAGTWGSKVSREEPTQVVADRPGAPEKRSLTAKAPWAKDAQQGAADGGEQGYSRAQASTAEEKAAPRGGWGRQQHGVQRQTSAVNTGSRWGDDSMEEDDAFRPSARFSTPSQPPPAPPTSQPPRESDYVPHGSRGGDSKDYGPQSRYGRYDSDRGPRGGYGDSYRGGPDDRQSWGYGGRGGYGERDRDGGGGSRAFNGSHWGGHDRARDREYRDREDHRDRDYRDRDYRDRDYRERDRDRDYHGGGAPPSGSSWGGGGGGFSRDSAYDRGSGRWDRDRDRPAPYGAIGVAGADSGPPPYGARQYGNAYAAGPPPPPPPPPAPPASQQAPSSWGVGDNGPPPARSYDSYRGPSRGSAAPVNARDGTKGGYGASAGREGPASEWGQSTGAAEPDTRARYDSGKDGWGQSAPGDGYGYGPSSTATSRASSHRESPTPDSQPRAHSPAPMAAHEGGQRTPRSSALSRLSSSESQDGKERMQLLPGEDVSEYMKRKALERKRQKELEQASGKEKTVHESREAPVDKPLRSPHVDDNRPTSPIRSVPETASHEDHHVAPQEQPATPAPAPAPSAPRTLFVRPRPVTEQAKPPEAGSPPPPSRAPDNHAHAVDNHAPAASRPVKPQPRVAEPITSIDLSAPNLTPLTAGAKQMTSQARQPTPQAVLQRPTQPQSLYDPARPFASLFPGARPAMPVATVLHKGIVVPKVAVPPPHPPQPLTVVYAAPLQPPPPPVPSAHGLTDGEMAEGPDMVGRAPMPSGQKRQLFDPRQNRMVTVDASTKQQQQHHHHQQQQQQQQQLKKPPQPRPEHDVPSTQARHIAAPPPREPRPAHDVGVEVRQPTKADEPSRVSGPEPVRRPRVNEAGAVGDEAQVHDHDHAASVVSDAAARALKEQRRAQAAEKAEKARKVREAREKERERRDAARKEREEKEAEEREAQREAHEAEKAVRREVRAKERASRGPRTKGVLYKYGENGEIVNADVTEEEMAARAEAREKRRQVQQQRAERAAAKAAEKEKEGDDRRKEVDRDRKKKRDGATESARVQKKVAAPREQRSSDEELKASAPAPPPVPPPPPVNAWSKPLLQSALLAEIVARERQAEQARLKSQGLNAASSQQDKPAEPGSLVEAQAEQRTEGRKEKRKQRKGVKTEAGEDDVADGEKRDVKARGKKRDGKDRVGADAGTRIVLTGAADHRVGELGFGPTLGTSARPQQLQWPPAPLGRDDFSDQGVNGAMSVEEAVVRFGTLTDDDEPVDSRSDRPTRPSRDTTTSPDQSTPTGAFATSTGLPLGAGSGTSSAWVPPRPSDRMSPMAAWSATWGPPDAAFAQVLGQASPSAEMHAHANGQPQHGETTPEGKRHVSPSPKSHTTGSVEYPAINVTSWFPLARVGSQPTPLLMQPPGATWQPSVQGAGSFLTSNASDTLQTWAVPVIPSSAAGLVGPNPSPLSGQPPSSLPTTDSAPSPSTAQYLAVGFKPVGNGPASGSELWGAPYPVPMLDRLKATDDGVALRALGGLISSTQPDGQALTDVPVDTTAAGTELAGDVAPETVDAVDSQHQQLQQGGAKGAKDGENGGRDRSGYVARGRGRGRGDGRGRGGQWRGSRGHQHQHKVGGFARAPHAHDAQAPTSGPPADGRGPRVNPHHAAPAQTQGGAEQGSAESQLLQSASQHPQHARRPSGGRGRGVGKRHGPPGQGQQGEGSENRDGEGPRQHHNASHGGARGGRSGGRGSFRPGGRRGAPKEEKSQASMNHTATARPAANGPVSGKVHSASRISGPN